MKCRMCQQETDNERRCDDCIRQEEYENKILWIIDNQDDITRSDLQGMVTALVMKIMKESK